ncbi:glycosyltransferase family 2 protein [Candidatus Shapirobacteria bacterium]|nr:glycosyltransferase family 2 protein [Candidatus Shapirobacteria bacterium]
MKPSQPLLSIIIVSYNTRELLEQCLNSVINSLSCHPESSSRHPDESQDLPSAEIIVVDNHSQDDSVEMLKNLKLKLENSKKTENLKLKIIVNNDNLGFAKANNQGIKESRGKYILLLNSDTIVKDKALEKMVSFMEEKREFAILGPKLLNADGTPQPSLGKFPTLKVVTAMLFLEHFFPASFLRVRWSPKNGREGDWVMGAALLFRREVYDKVGGLDENLFMYMEEVEWCFRAKKAGFCIYFYPEAEIIHLGRGSSKSGKKEPILQIFRGLIYFYQKHQPPWQQKILLLLLKLKANLSFSLGVLTGNSYLRKTYGEAKKII